MAQQVKDPALSLQQLRLLLWRGFDPWPRNFCTLQDRPKKKNKTTLDVHLKFSHMVKLFQGQCKECLKEINEKKSCF